MAFEEPDPLSAVFGVVFALLGVGVLLPTGYRQVRQLLRTWAESDRDPAADARLRAPGRSLAWLLASFAWAASGLYVAFAGAASVLPNDTAYGEVAYYLGLGMILWITGLLGLAKAGTHYRWAVRAFRRPTAR